MSARLKAGEDPRTVSLNNFLIWIQIHGMDPGFMSQRVVQDIGNYIGKFEESDPNNFVGVWRDYLRVRVMLSIEKPLKRRMKLKKNEGQWCWANFRYEGLPTFCFICGIIGHNERYCERLFDTPVEKIEKPYGVWMKAEPRRRTYTEGSRWLRQGRSGPAVTTVAEGSQTKESTISNNLAVVVQQPVKSAEDVSNVNHGKEVMQIPNKGGQSNNSMEIISGFNLENTTRERENNVKEIESNGLVILDTKRRRTEEANILDKNDDQAQRDEEMLDSLNSNSSNQKNLYGAGAASQARLAL